MMTADELAALREWHRAREAEEKPSALRQAARDRIAAKIAKRRQENPQCYSQPASK